jgi:thiol-disulfide isomerase/thioredoxin
MRSGPLIPMKLFSGAIAGMVLLGLTGPAWAVVTAKDAWREIDQLAKALPKIEQQQAQREEDRGQHPFAGQSGDEDQAITNQLALLMLRLDWFIQQFPDDKRVMQAHAWWVQTAPQVAARLGTTLDRERYEREIALLETAKDLPPAIQADADYAVIRTTLERYASKGIAPAEYEKLLGRMEGFSRRFPRDWRAPGMAYTVGQILQNKDEARARAGYTIAARSSDEEMAANAALALAALPYRHRPLDLAFKATDGQRFDLSLLRGKVVVVDFWATWCPPCRAEAPEMAAFYQKYHDHGVEIVGISLDEERGKLEQFTKKNDMRWPQYFDALGWQNKVSQRFEIHSIPAVWVVGPDGRIVSTDARGRVEEIVQALLARRDAPPGK